jgi:hypothetical protein
MPFVVRVRGQDEVGIALDSECEFPANIWRGLHEGYWTDN